MTTKNPGPMYPNLNPWELEPYYSQHVAAMTAEGLHSKAAIAEQLAWRDKRIAELEARATSFGMRDEPCDYEDKMIRLPHTHESGDDCLACDVKLVHESCGLSLKLREAEAALYRIESALAEYAQMSPTERETMRQRILREECGF